MGLRPLTESGLREHFAERLPLVPVHRSATTFA